MLGAIGPSVLAGSSGLGKSTAGFEAQLAQYEIQLSDWTHCSSCNTPEGKAKIAEISDKISEIKQRIKSAEAQRQIAPANVPVRLENQTQNTVPPVSVASALTADSAKQPSSSLTGTIGSRLDVYV